MNSSDAQRLKRQRTQTKLVPWCNDLELQTVGTALLSAAELFSTEHSSEIERNNIQNSSATDTHRPTMLLEQALAHVSVWRSRSTKLPHAVESTAALARVLWRERSAPHSSSAEELRLAYSCAVVRGINGSADPLQQQRAMATSVAYLCRQLGIPEWLVDLRHEATHNQIPSLPTLRMASINLLQYFQTAYWNPIFEGRRTDFEQILSILCDYEKAADETARRSQSSSLTSDAKRSPKSKEEDERSSSEKDSVDTSEDFVWTSRIGTTSNMFAALQSERSSKRKGPEEKIKEKRKAPKKKRKGNSSDPSPSTISKKLVEADVPTAVVLDAILSHLLWGPTGCDGKLIPGDVEEFPESEKSVQKLKDRYHVLLLTLGRAWSGLPCRLLIETVDLMLVIERRSKSESQSVADSGGRRKLFFLASWIRYLVSTSFASLFVRCSKEAKGTGKSVRDGSAPLEALRALRYPLNALCDRCDEDTTTPHGASSRAVCELFLSILGEERVVGHGVEYSQSASPIQNSETTTIADQPDQTTEKLSLAELEALLDSPAERDNNSGEMHTDDTQSPLYEKPELSHFDRGSSKEASPLERTAWVKCISWEASAIGTLPATPVINAYSSIQ